VTNGVFSIPLHVPAAGKRAQRGPGRPAGLILREFIGDEQNYLVPVAADAVLLPGLRFNPIVFHGPTGTGKTSLARGLVHLWSTRNPRKTAVITNGADFCREYANAVDTDSLPDFRKRFRSPALLLIDDLDPLHEKTAAQDELIGTLDELARRQGQVLVTMKQAPLETAGLSPALASRLSGGLSVPMTTPGEAGRRRILEHLLKLHGLELPEEAIDLLAQTPDNASPRPAPAFTDLSQLVMRLVASQDNEDGKFGVSDVENMLATLEPAEGMSLRSITRQVAKYFHLHVADLKGPTRQQRVVRARGVAMLLARQLTGESLEQIGQHFGKRDHTTVLHACRKTEELMSSDPAIRQAVEDLSERLSFR